ncbi:MAG: hypothetical protein INF16_05000 [Methylobacterium sp.]|nr:hypothetical protein [Methylobacterium sp.]
MTMNSVLRKAALGASLTILMAGFALAQSAPPAPAPAAPAMTQRQMMEACRAEISRDLRGPERRDAMRQCVEKKRESAGLDRREDRRAGREARRSEHRAQMQECRREFAEQKLTEKERRDAVEGCLAKKDPHFAKMVECRKQSEEKKLEHGSRAFRKAMRDCMGPQRG